MLPGSIVEERISIFGPDYIPPDMLILLKLEDLIDRNFKLIKKPDFYAAELGFSLYRLNEISRLYRGKTVYELWQQRLLQEAEKLLTYTGLSAKEIALELNCCDAAYFTNRFKKWKGMTPKEFKKMVGSTP